VLYGLDNEFRGLGQVGEIDEAAKAGGAGVEDRGEGGGQVGTVNLGPGLVHQSIAVAERHLHEAVSV
jgi:hypothetical protein